MRSLEVLWGYLPGILRDLVQSSSGFLLRVVLRVTAFAVSRWFLVSPLVRGPSKLNSMDKGGLLGDFFEGTQGAMKAIKALDHCQRPRLCPWPALAHLGPGSDGRCLDLTGRNNRRLNLGPGTGRWRWPKPASCPRTAQVQSPSFAEQLSLGTWTVPSLSLLRSGGRTGGAVSSSPEPE